MKPNEEQQAVIDSNSERIVCIAGAGAGKTATLCARITRLIKDGADPASMVAITFTNAAADELQSRIGVKLGYCGTLHSFLLRQITLHHQLAGLPATLSVMDSEQKESLVKSLLEELNVKTSLKLFLPLLERNDLIESKKGANRTRDELAAIEFHRRLRSSGLLDFDKILFYGLKLMLALDAGIEQENSPWEYLFYDEVQDSSDMDFAIIEAMPCKNKFLVGDDAQGIYSFRGGNVQNMLNLPANGWETFALQTNYRSGDRICAAANNLIAHNQGRYQKQTLAHRKGGMVEVRKHKVPANEMGSIVDEINGLIGGDKDALMPPHEIAILARTNALANEFASFLESLGIPVARKKYVAMPSDWKLAKMLLTVMANPYNDLAVHQFISQHANKKVADQMRIEAAKQMKPLCEIGPIGIRSGKDGIALSMTHAGISSASRERIHDAARILSGKGEWSINQLILALHENGSEEMTPGITCSTIHASKGREYGCVFLVGVEQGTIPSSRGDLEEERRLLYVGITRSKEKLYISHCENRPVPFKEWQLQPRLPSQFIAECKL